MRSCSKNNKYPTSYYSLGEGDLLRLLRSFKNLPFVFLESASFDQDNKTSLLFTDFIKILTFNHNQNPDDFFKEVEEYRKNGFWLCGYFAYEFGYFLEPALYHLKEKSYSPLVWLGVCREPIVISHLDYKPYYNRKQILSCRAENLKPDITQDEYSSQIRKIKHCIEKGLSYQVNYTFKIKFDFKGDFLDFYFQLKNSQPTSYMSLINTANSCILSFSPELFFRLERDKLITRPMKGTAPRGTNPFQDRSNRNWLARNKKIKAENIMIVDLLRNDLGRISDKVWVSKLFNIEKYRTLYQLTSTIESKLKKNIKIKDIFSSLFPSGSVTGAPKIKTMKIIKGLEKKSRGIYTGAIGYIKEDKACFNVAIRTVSLNGGKGEMGTGGGILYDSLEKSEYQEALLKSKFLTEKFPELSLIESILWQPEKGYFLLGLHLKRLRRSCEYFSIPYNLERLKEELGNLEKGLIKKRFKVKIILDLDGQINVEKEELEPVCAPVKVKISFQKINPDNIFLYHKTNQRILYEQEKKKAQKQGFFEVIFLNTKNQLTEGTITNIFLLKKRCLYTPPIYCGLLAGVLREHLLKEGKARERVLYLKDFLEADRVFIGNSVRGLLEAQVS